MRHSILAVGMACLIAAPTAARSQSLAEGTWTVIEHCGENTATKDPKLKPGYDRQTQLVVANGRISGHDSTVRKRDGAVTNTTYDGTIEGAKIMLSGTGLRSDQNQPWTYIYGGTVTADGHAELNGGIFAHVASSEKSVMLRVCSISFVALKDAAPAGATPAAAPPDPAPK